MQLIAMHRNSKNSGYIEGFHEQYCCVVYWKSLGEFIEIMDISCFRYTKENRVPRLLNPFGSELCN